ncbi:MAG TPA: hypothetical protein VLT62_06245 [Candidatus Methylomirabilis sp.]|nr:hypothetical protein [Candidatus Methylomirabilis sp.]
MAQPETGQETQKPCQAAQRWMLSPGAPDWLRRIWGERIRTVPLAPKLDPSRIRRIAYL